MTDPPDSDLTRLTLVDASAAVAGRQLSPVELTEAYLDRIAATAPVVNAYTTVVAVGVRTTAGSAVRPGGRGTAGRPAAVRSAAGRPTVRAVTVAGAR